MLWAFLVHKVRGEGRALLPSDVMWPWQGYDPDLSTHQRGLQAVMDYAWCARVPGCCREFCLAEQLATVLVLQGTDWHNAFGFTAGFLLCCSGPSPSTRLWTHYVFQPTEAWWSNPWILAPSRAAWIMVSHMLSPAGCEAASP